MCHTHHHAHSLFLTRTPACITTQVKANFERFISCKTTIDDIYDKLQRVESSGAAMSTEVLFKRLTEASGLSVC